MDDSVATHIQFENGPMVPIQYITPFSIKQTRGLDPYMFGVTTSTLDGIPTPSAGDAVKCSFVFEAPGTSGRQTKEWKGWYLVRIEPSRTMSGLWTMVFADERWRVQYRRFTMSYNVQWPDGSFREGTASGPQGWETKDAIVDAFGRMGYKLDVSEVPVVTGDKLPFNLGNSPAGGWVQASFEEIVGPMLAALQMDLIIRTNGKFAVVPRVGKPPQGVGFGAAAAEAGDGKLEKLRAYSRIVDTVDATLNNYERPRKLRVAFEIKAEAAVESEIANTSSSSPATPIFGVPENVMPRFEPKLRDPELWWDNEITPADTDWNLISSELFLAGYLPTLTGAPSGTPVDEDQFIGDNYFLPYIIPLLKNQNTGKILETIEELEKKEWFDSTLRNTWRRTYRIAFPTARNPHPLVKDERRMAGIRLGRLTPGGDTYSRGSVFCDWCEETTDEQGLTDNPLDASFSSNHPLSDNIARPAPFVARWIAESGGELIFELAPLTSSRIGQARILPGLFSQHMNWRGYFFAIAGLEANDSTRGKLSPDFDFRIIMAGRLIGEDERDKSALDSKGVDIQGRYAVIEQDTAFTNGNIDCIDFKANIATANFGYTKDQLEKPIGTLAAEFPAKLLNESELRDIQRRILTNMQRDFRLGRAGGVKMAGIDAMGEVETGGDVYEFSLAVGDPDPWAITTQWVFAPAAIAWSVDPEKRDGRTPAAIEQE